MGCVGNPIGTVLASVSGTLEARINENSDPLSTMAIAEQHDDTLVAPPHLDAASRLNFRRAALEHLERVIQRHQTCVVIDLQHTTGIDASGLGVLVLVQKRARERLVTTKLLHAPASVKQLIALTRLDYLFEVED